MNKGQSEESISASAGEGINTNDPQTMLSMLAELANITDYETALDHIEIVADTIDSVCETINMSMDLNSSMDSNTERTSDFLLDNDVIGLFLRLLKSPCEEVIKLTLNGLDKLIGNSQISKLIVKGGGFAVIAELLILTNEDVYLKTKASDVITYLIAPTEHKRLKIEILDNGVYEEHVTMLLSSNEEFVERAAQFLWCLTDNCDTAQVKIAEDTQVVDKLLKTIAESDVGRNSLRVILNLVKSEGARAHLPKKQILLLMRSILKIPDEHMSEKDKNIAAVVFGYLYDKEMDVDQALVVRFADLLYDSLYGVGRVTHSLEDILSGIDNFTENHKILPRLADFTIIKTVLSIFALEEDFATSKGIQNLSNAKVLASKIILAFSQENAVMEQQTEGLIDEDTTEIFHVLMDGADQDLADNITKILKNIARFNHEKKKRQQAAKIAEIAAKMAEEADSAINNDEAEELSAIAVEVQVFKEVAIVPEEESAAKPSSRSNSPTLTATRSRSSSNAELTPRPLSNSNTEVSSPRSRSKASSSADMQPPRPSTPTTTHAEPAPASAPAKSMSRSRSSSNADIARPKSPVMEATKSRSRSSSNADILPRPKSPVMEAVKSRSRSSSFSELDPGLKTVITERLEIDSSGTVDTISIEKSHFDNNEMLVKSELFHAAVHHDTNMIKLEEAEVSVENDQTTVTNKREVVIPTEELSDYVRTAPPFDPSQVVDNIVSSALESLGKKVDEKLRQIADEQVGNSDDDADEEVEVEEIEADHHTAVPVKYGLEDAGHGVETRAFVSSTPPHIGEAEITHNGKRLSGWQYEDVSGWLKKIGLAHVSETFVKNRINGVALLEMKRRVEDVKFLKLAAESLKLDCFGDLLTISAELRKLGH